ncbi:E set [Glarea lozoyensis ATCC 20868]|uniref:Phosphatidylglycerol/phosphatidylinositol transfer protein n=2 Tax=Glarea lozoyensis TaxID=101852 RepID=S3D203_GLAL2|nr:E set [Glarea lozoyensis ATCC 20868]EHL02735.1 putative Phosphatidylglycerol/phosphatidylinositol transfer protein [Glarea lozoyensis 74030]EPE26086.1 E set [Glarea lozoyensis ATCC 20868]
MKFSLALTSLFLSSFVSAAGVSFFSNGQKVLEDKGEAIPGDNPLIHCKKDHDENILVLDHVNLTPNPPVPGQKLTIEAVGTLSEKIEQGAYVNLQVKYGLIKLLSTRADMCEQIANVDLKCPVDKGKITLTKDVDIPKEIPGGTYTVVADAYTQDEKKIVCLEATVKF